MGALASRKRGKLLCCGQEMSLGQVRHLDRCRELEIEKRGFACDLAARSVYVALRTARTAQAL
jgi:hypothetical protein